MAGRPEDPSETVVFVPGQRSPSEDLTESMELWEEPAPPEPLEAEWLHHATWVLPASLTLVIAGLGMWSGPVAVVTDGYYGELIGWWDGVVGGSAAALRAPSVVAMGAAAAVIAVVGTRIGGRRVGVMAGLLFAVLPATSQWARDTRPVAVAVLLCVAATLLVMTLIERPRVVAAIGYAAAVVLLGVVGGGTVWLVLAAHLVGVVAYRRSWRTVLLWGPGALAGAAAPLLVGDDPLAGGVRLAAAGSPGELFGPAVVAGAVLGLAFLGASLRRPAGVVTWWALVPVGGLITAAALVPVWAPERLMVTVPAFVLLASAAIRRFTLARGVCALLAVALLGVPQQLELRGQAPAVWVTPS